MSKWIRLPGFLPPEKQDSVEFYFLKSLSYSNRMVSYLALVGIGFLFQIFSMKAWPGIGFLFFATLLNLIKGCDSRINLKDFYVDSNWTQVDMERINRIGDIRRKTTNWDIDMLDISNPKGCFSFVVTLGLLIFGSYVLMRTSYFNDILGIIIIDAVILILPLWFSGIRRMMGPKKLGIKVDIIKSMEEFFRSIKQNGEIFKPALLLARDKRGASIPKDSRFTITFENMPEGFYGIQAQINLNKVEASTYPYFYCVIAAKKGFGLMNHVKNIPENEKVIVNYEEDNDAEVIVIRQYTTNSSGYHTNTTDCKRILELSLKAARGILAGHR